MKKIVITETQLKRLTKFLVTESVNYNDTIISYNPDGTISVKDKSIDVKIRLIHTKNPTPLSGDGPWEINIVNLNLQDKGLNFETKKGRKGLIPKNVLDSLINYVKSNDRNNKFLMDGGLAGQIFAKKV